MCVSDDNGDYLENSFHFLVKIMMCTKDDQQFNEWMKTNENWIYIKKNQNSIIIRMRSHSCFFVNQNHYCLKTKINKNVPNVFIWIHRSNKQHIYDIDKRYTNVIHYWKFIANEKIKFHSFFLKKNGLKHEPI